MPKFGKSAPGSPDPEQQSGRAMRVTGSRDDETGAIRIIGNLGAKPRGEFVADLLAAIKERRA